MFASLSDGDKVLILGIVTVLVAPTWLAWWNSRVAKKQVQPNGGTSLKDQMTRVEAKVDTLKIVQGLHTEQIALAATKAEESSDVAKAIDSRLHNVELNQGKTNMQINLERISHPVLPATTPPYGSPTINIIKVLDTEANEEDPEETN